MESAPAAGTDFVIDLHSHSNESDGTYTPAELVAAAIELKLDALAITDHDTLAGYRLAKPLAEAGALRLICGIELSTKLYHPNRRTVHLLAYFFHGEPSGPFSDWIVSMQAARRDRNQRLAKRLQELGVDVRIEEVEALGKSMAGRPHFARLLIEKGYVRTSTEAFDRYLDESAPGYVDREEPSLEEAIRRVREAGGVSSLAHPIRLGKRDYGEEEALIASVVAMGLSAIEAYHSDHSPLDAERYLRIAGKYGLKVTGGSDFHGGNKPSVRLGQVNVPASLLDALSQ